MNQESAQNSDFSRIASRYDATRHVPKAILAKCYARLIEDGLLPATGSVLDVGCGTGQMSLVLAEDGYDIHGIDISREMIEMARSKVRHGWRAEFVVGDGCHLPHGDKTFDCVIVSKLLQHVGNWQEACRETIRVARAKGHIFHINERGAFGNSVRRFFSARANERGFTRRYLGLDPHSRTELVAFMASQGCRTIAIAIGDLCWEADITYGEALSQLEERLFAEFWYLPEDIHRHLLADTAGWIDAQPNGSSTVERLKPYLSVEVFTVP